jgi:hypothetical protein
MQTAQLLWSKLVDLELETEDAATLDVSLENDIHALPAEPPEHNLLTPLTA